MRTSITQSDSQMELREFFSEDAIKLDLAGTSKDDILRELIGLLKLDEKSDGMLFKMLKRRENLGSTGIGRGIAIPHCRSLVVNKLRVAFGRKKEGVDFKAIDEKPVHFFFLIVAPPLEVSNQYLPVLGKIAQFSKEPDVPARLLEITEPNSSSRCSRKRASRRLAPPDRSFPLDRRRRLGADVVDDAVDAAHFVDDPVGDAAEHVVRKGIPVGRHAVGARHGAEREDVLVGAVVAHHADAAHREAARRTPARSRRRDSAVANLLEIDRVGAAQHVERRLASPRRARECRARARETDAGRPSPREARARGRRCALRP